MRSYFVREVYGPFHRLLAPEVQDAATVVKQFMSGQVWGKPPSWGGSPAVKAYRDGLPKEQSGIEFWAFQEPDTPAGSRIYWRSEGPFAIMDLSGAVLKLEVAFVKVTQDLHMLVQ